MFELGSVVAKITADTKDFKSKLSEAQGSMQSFSSKASDSLKTIQKGSAIATVAITGIATASFMLAKEAGKYESIRDAFGSMTKGLVDDVDEFQSAVAKASGNTIDNLTILQNGTKALSLIGKDSFNNFQDDFAEMAMLSKKAARATGQDVNFMFESLVTGVARSSKLILDNLGINVDLSEAYDTFAQKVGKAADELTAQEQKTALLNAAMEQLKTNYGDVAVSSGGAQGKIQQLETAMTNFRLQLGDAVIPVLVDLVNALLPLIQQYLPPLIEFVKNLVLGFQNLDPWMQKFILVLLLIAPALTILLPIIGMVGAAIGALGIPISILIAAVVTLVSMIIANWAMLRDITIFTFEFLKQQFMSFVTMLYEWGVKIYDAITKPFKDAFEFAKKKVEEIRSAIASALDMDKKNSPSINDRLRMLREGVNETFASLKVPELSSEIAASLAIPQGAGGFNQNVNIQTGNISSAVDITSLGREFAFATQSMPGVK